MLPASRAPAALWHSASEPALRSPGVARRAAAAAGGRALAPIPSEFLVHPCLGTQAAAPARRPPSMARGGGGGGDM